MATSRHIKRQGICAGGLRHLITVQLRSIGPPNPGTANPTDTFSDVKDVFAGIETLRGTRRWAGVHIRKEATHLFFIRFDPDLSKLEDGNHFILFDERRFRVLEVTNHQEDRRYLIVQATERGDADTEAASA